MDALWDEERYREFVKYVTGKGYQVFPISAAGRQGIEALLAAAAKALEELWKLPEEDDYDYYDMELMEQEGEDYRKIEVRRENRTFVLSGGQLEKIFDSTNFNDTESLRYLYKYIEEKGAMAKMIEMGIEEGDTVRIKNFEFEYYD